VRGSLDRPAPGSEVGDAVSLGGWVLFEDGPTARVEAWLGERPLGRARLGLPRPDVAAVREGPDAAVSGFELDAGLDPDGAEGEVLLRALATSVAGERHEFEPVPLRRVAPEAPPAPGPPRPKEAPEAGRRILAFTNVLTLGGASIYFLDLLLEARRRGRLAPVVVTAIDGPLRDELEAAGIPVHVLSSIPLHEPAAYEDRLEELGAWATGRGFESVFVNTATGLSLPGADLAERLGIPAVWAIHESFRPAVLWSGVSPALRERGEAALRRAALGIFEADATREIYREALGERSLTIPYGIDAAAIERERAGFEIGAARHAVGVPDDAELVICVGTIEPRKAQVSLLQAFELVAERHPRAQLAFVGGTDDEGSRTLAGRIESSPLGERARVVPQTRDVQAWHGMADLLVCASDIESLPRTVLEAMLWETPVLATAIFGLPELIDDGVNGWLCEPGDVGALAEGLDTALEAGPVARARIGAAARALVLERHALGRYVERMADLIDEAADGGPLNDGRRPSGDPIS
jgi:D-inositol-3-phosphate glycosyltransferase